MINEKGNQNQFKSLIYNKLADIPNGDRNIIVSEKMGRIVIAQKFIVLNSKEEPVDVFMKNPISLEMNSLEKLIIALVQSLAKKKKGELRK